MGGLSDFGRAAGDEAAQFDAKARALSGTLFDVFPEIRALRAACEAAERRLESSIQQRNQACDEFSAALLERQRQVLEALAKRQASSAAQPPETAQVASNVDPSAADAVEL